MAEQNAPSKRPITRVLIVEDHPIVRRGLCNLINEEKDLEVCGQAEGVAEAIRLFDEIRPDITLVDLMLGDGDGMEMLRHARHEWVGIRMIVVSSRDNPCFHAARALKAGALGYVSKDDAVDHIIDAIHQVQHGNVYVSPSADHMSEWFG